MGDAYSEAIVMADTLKYSPNDSDILILKASATEKQIIPLSH
jgi:hypothetical protein